MFLNCIH